MERLRDIDLFSELTDEDLEEIKGMLRIKRVKKGSIILYEKDTNRVMYIVLSGKVKVTQVTEDGKEIILAIHTSGEFFGEVSLIDKKTVPATVEAMEDSTVALITEEDFNELLRNFKFTMSLLKIFSRRLREAWRKIYMLNLKNATDRMKVLFLTLMTRHGKPQENGMLLDIPLTHQEIADMAGLSRETVTRVIDRWKKEDLIRVLRRGVILLREDFFRLEIP